MFIGKNTLAIRYDNVNITPATNIESVYVELIEQVIDASMPEYHIYKRAITKRMPIQYYTSDVDISVYASDYEYRNITYGIPYDELRDPENDYGKYTYTNLKDGDDSNIIALSDSSMWIFKNIELHLLTKDTEGNAKKYLIEDISTNYDLGLLLKSFETKLTFVNITENVKNDFGIFNKQLIKKTKTRKTNYWDASIMQMWEHLDEVCQCFIGIDSSIKALIDDIDAYHSIMRTHICTKLSFLNHIKNGELIPNDFYLTKIYSNNSKWFLFRALSSTTLFLKAYICDNVNYQGTSRTIEDINTCSFTIIGEIRIDSTKEIETASDIDITYMYTYNDNIKAPFDFIITGNLVGKNIEVLSSNNSIDIRSGKNITIEPECSHISILNADDITISYDSSNITVTNSSYIEIGKLTNNIEVDFSKFVTIGNLNTSIHCENAYSNEIGVSCVSINITGNNNIIASNVTNALVNGDNNTILSGDSNIILNNVSNNIIYQNNEGISCSSTFDMLILQSGINEKYDERDNHLFIPNMNIVKSDGSAPNIYTYNNEVINTSVFNFNCSTATPFLAKEKTFTIHGRELPAYVLHFQGQDPTTSIMDHYNYIKLDSSVYDLSTNASTWKIYYWEDDLKLPTYTIGSDNQPLALIVTVEHPEGINYPWMATHDTTNPGLTAGTYLKYIDNTSSRVSKKMQLDIEYDKDKRLHHYVNYQVSPHDDKAFGINVYVTGNNFNNSSIKFEVPVYEYSEGTPRKGTGNYWSTFNANFNEVNVNGVLLEVYSTGSMVDGRINVMYNGYNINDITVDASILLLDYSSLEGPVLLGLSKALHNYNDPEASTALGKTILLTTQLYEVMDELNINYDYSFNTMLSGHTDGWSMEMTLENSDTTFIQNSSILVKMFNQDDFSKWNVQLLHQVGYATIDPDTGEISYDAGEFDSIIYNGSIGYGQGIYRGYGPVYSKDSEGNRTLIGNKNLFCFSGTNKTHRLSPVTIYLDTISCVYSKRTNVTNVYYTIESGYYILHILPNESEKPETFFLRVVPKQTNK